MSLLSLNDVSHSYWRGPREISVLKKVSLDVHPGDLVGVYGQRSSGKTTLLKVAAGFEKPDTGTVRFAGQDLSEIPTSELAALHRRHIAWVERAGPHISELPACVYVEMPLYGRVSPAQARRRAIAALTRVGAHDCAHERWQDIPDTARVLVAIAHGIVRKPRLLLIDDPTVGLGMTDREHIVGFLRSAAEEAQVGIVMAVPDMPSMLQANEVRMLSRGRLVGPSDTDQGNVVNFPQHRRA